MIDENGAYPVGGAIPEVEAALRSHGAAVLQAPPGAGKTTRVAPALLGAAWLGGRRIVMLEPRRLAARAAARWMAGRMGEREGETVGYRVRGDTRVGARTRIEVVTEGVLTRMLQSDPALDGVGLVIFDEFHERSLHADLGLALCLQSRELLRDDLRLLVMSATLDVEAIAGLLGGAPIVASQGRSFPVETHYLERRHEGPVVAAIPRAVSRALEHEGDVLVFLPGAGEIRAAARALEEARVGDRARIVPLFGDLPPEEQDRAIRPSPPGERKVVLATSIAETSLTIGGVRSVVDSGVMRVPRFSPRTGMSGLATVPVTLASAEQRRGRAGREGPGVCYRLWTEAEHAGRVPHGTPEILQADLVPLALELAVWGAREVEELRWLDLPPAAALAQAREVLEQLGAVGADGAVTPHGRRIAEVGLHPRLAHMVLRGAALGHGAAACDLAALLDERDLFRADSGAADVDLRLRLELLHAQRSPGSRRRQGERGAAEPGRLRRVLAESERLRKRLGIPAAGYDAEAAGLLVALAFPDRVARRRRGAGGRFLLRNGRGAALPAA
jgi:ATP-dependent helicase HrpB